MKSRESSLLKWGGNGEKNYSRKRNYKPANARHERDHSVAKIDSAQTLPRGGRIGGQGLGRGRSALNKKKLCVIESLGALSKNAEAS